MNSRIAFWALFTAILNIIVTLVLVSTRPERQLPGTILDLLNVARSLREAGACGEAVEAYEQVLARTEHSSEAPVVAYELAQVHMRCTYDMRRAYATLRKAAEYIGTEAAAHAQSDLAFFDRNYPSSGSVMRFWFMASEARKRGESEMALRLLDILVADSPPRSIRADALLAKGRYLTELKRRDEAGAALLEFVKSYPHHPDHARGMKALADLP